MNIDRKVLAVARAIHIAKVQECSFPNHDGPSGFEAKMRREPWPENRAEEAKLLHAGQPWMEIAIAQAKAAIRVMKDQLNDH